MPSPEPLPWRAPLANWPDEWRERWGRRANALEEAGLGWREAERQAWNETLALKREAVERVPERVARGTTRAETSRTLFREAG